MLKNGSMLNDRYEIVGVVGSGGMSDVYKAKCHKLNRYVAIKVLKKEFSDDKNFVAKFRAEAQSAAGLSHPNIVNIYDVGEDRGLYYIVMELVEGITLKAYIEKKGRLEVKESVSIAIQVSQGIRAAHTHHIIHRDIKPQNIIISKDGKVKVTDFGIARVSSTQTINSNTMGSVHYISPEQARGGYVDERGDIYSLGISLYEMITGKVPFDSDTPVSVALMHIQNEIPSPRNIVPNLPVAVEKIIYKCTQKKADRRYSDADALIEDLRNCLVNTNARMDDMNSVGVTASAKGKNINDKAEGNSKALAKLADVTEGTNNSKTTMWNKEDIEKEKHRKKDFLEKMYEDKRKNPIVEGVITGAIVLVAIAICAFLIWGIVWIKKTLTPPEIFNPATSESSSNNTITGISDVSMPKLMGYESGDAIIELNKLNLKNSLKYEYSDAYAKGEVIAQQYREGTKLKRNTVVELVISLGKIEYRIEDYTNLDATMVEETFDANKIKINRIFVYNSEVDMGCVVKTYPIEGEIVKSGDIVDVYISRGTELKNVTVPSLEGLTIEEANATLDPKGLKIGNVTYVESKTVEEGKIMTQSYLFNSVLLQGSSIDVTVSLGSGVPITSITLQQSQFTRYIHSDNNEFRKPFAPGASLDTTYPYAMLSLELEQTDTLGAIVTKNIGTYTISPVDLPMQINDIEGIEDVYDGTITVHITIGDSRYKVGSYYVEFQ
ncbi:MAG: Stk1 family PASTA domain-containing Ser/Thr kinase [Lachnospiraceae bacterium]|nr:Stk1 family PASTA domain-containing Ser/Thr kinase [Lachnospiraceae bacterium]